MIYWVVTTHPCLYHLSSTNSHTKQRCAISLAFGKLGYTFWSVYNEELLPPRGAAKLISHFRVIVSMPTHQELYVKVCRVDRGLSFKMLQSRGFQAPDKILPSRRNLGTHVLVRRCLGRLHEESCSPSKRRLLQPTNA